MTIFAGEIRTWNYGSSLFSSWTTFFLDVNVHIELGAQNIRVNTICPTFIKTPMTAGMQEDAAFRNFVSAKIALSRIGKVEDIMGAVVYLVSDASLLVTGSSLMIYGGWTAA